MHGEFSFLAQSNPMLNAFKIKPFDLDPVYESWADGQRFVGNPKKDPPVDEWLKTIKTGCKERHVPKEYWHKVGKHFMGDKAKARFDELKAVMAQVHGGRYRWNWKKYKIAMRNMAWDIDDTETEAIKVQGKPFWWFARKNSQDATVDEEVPAPCLARSETWTVVPRQSGKDGGSSFTPRRPPQRSMSAPFWLTRRITESDPDHRPSPQKMKSDTDVVSESLKEAVKSLPPLPIAETVATVNAPAWLLKACSALDFLQNEHPKVMSTLSAVLIAAGTLPTIPAISAGAGGAILASGAAHTIGAVAVALGSWLKAQQDGQVHLLHDTAK